MIQLYLKDLIHDCGKNVNDWDKIEMGEAILFYKKDDYSDKSGFMFYSCEIVGSDQEDNIMVEPLFHGYAYFDGIRHLWLGNDNYYDNFGYLNYPNICILIKILKELRNLEVKYCSDYFKGDF